MHVCDLNELLMPQRDFKAKTKNKKKKKKREKCIKSEHKKETRESSKNVRVL